LKGKYALRILQILIWNESCKYRLPSLWLPLSQGLSYGQDGYVALKLLYYNSHAVYLLITVYG